MIEIYSDGSSSKPIGKSWAKSGNIFGRFIIPITSRLRAYYSLKGLNKLDSHLDIGCGDCLFLNFSPCKRRVGLDIRFGDYVDNSLDFPDKSFDNVSMLAVIEHIRNPEQLLKEIHRVLKPEGRFIVTTPKKSAEWLIRLYAKEVIDDDNTGHVAHYDKMKLVSLTEDLYKLKVYKTFIFGMNQLFVFEKRM